MTAILSKKVVRILAVLVVVLCSLAAFSFRTTKLNALRGFTATTVNGQAVDTFLFDVSSFNNSVISVQARVSAIDLNSGDSKSFTREASFEVFNGVLSRVGHLTPNEFEAGDPHTGNWDVTPACDDVTGRLFLTIKGSANTTVEWRAVASIHLYQP